MYKRQEEDPDVNDALVPEPLDEDGTPRLHPILSNADYKAAQAKARVKLDKERHAKAMKAVEEAEMERLKMEEGMVTGDGVKDQMVKITLNLAPHSEDIKINGRAHWHGHTYTVPRHVADTMREIQARGWQHQDEIDGKLSLIHI